MKDQEIVTYILFDKSFASSDQSSRGIADSALQSFGLSKGSAILGSVTKILPVDDIHIEGIASSDASLVVGRSLTERLSVSYDFNLFNNSGIIKVRYEFGKGFSVQSRNAFDTNGIELLYSFER
jgi:autotransporter translocation and assembly factor TamB